MKKIIEFILCLRNKGNNDSAQDGTLLCPKSDIELLLRQRPKRQLLSRSHGSLNASRRFLHEHAHILFPTLFSDTPCLKEKFPHQK